ncbi:MAG: ATP-dependent zinc metalloprotease FtsH [Chloroflexota bacterium]
MSKKPPNNDPNNNGNNGNNNNNGNNPFGGRNTQRFWIIAIVVVSVLFLLTLVNQNTRQGAGNNTTLNEVVSQIQQGNVSTITTRGTERVIVELQNGETLSLYKEPSTNLIETLLNLGVTQQQLNSFDYEPQPGDETASILFQVFLAIGPLLIIVWLLWRMMRSVRGGQDQAMNFGRSKARVSRDMERPQVQFSDVAGNDEAKEELEEVVEFLKEPEKFIQLGARIPKGVLMIGPPGTGKTLMARAVAGEAGVPFFHISGSEFVEMFVGVGASRVRDLFDNAKKEAPAIIFIDEIDAVGRQRGAGLGGGHDEREQTLNQILVEMDGFENETNIIMIAATNRPDILDPALLRPGRFDRKVTMDTPDLVGREAILKVHARGKPLANDVDLESIARITPGMSGADLENLLNEAALLAARRNKRSIGMSELNESMERVAIGPARKSRVMTEREKRTIAYHEAGHAILFYVLEHTNAVHKITIIPRGRAGGYVLSLPNSDTNLRTREQFEDSLTATMGGRAAEEIIFGQITNGASGDLQQATNLSRAMVTQFGMSKSLGPRTFGSDSGNPFLGRGWIDERDYSEDAARQIDGEIQEITVAAYERAESILRANRDKLEMLAEMLMERETLDREEFEYLMEHGEMPGDISDVFDVPSEPSEPAATEPESYDNPTDGADAGETGSNLGPAPA